MIETLLEGKLQAEENHEAIPDGLARITIEVNSGNRETMEGLMRVLRIARSVSDIREIGNNGTLVTQLYAGNQTAPQLARKTEPPRQENQIQVDFKKLTPTAYKFNFTGINSAKVKAQLGEMLPAIEELGRTSNVEVDFTGRSGFYQASLFLETNRCGAKFIDQIREMIENVNFFMAGEGVMRDIHKFDEYLGRWKRGTPDFRALVGQDMKEMYEIICDTWRVKKKDILEKNAGKCPNIRAAIAYILYKSPGYRNKGERLSTIDIGDILNHDHSSVIAYLKKCSNVRLSESQLSNFKHSLPGIVESYISRTPMENHMVQREVCQMLDLVQQTYGFERDLILSDKYPPGSSDVRAAMAYRMHNHPDKRKQLSVPEIAKILHRSQSRIFGYLKRLRDVGLKGEMLEDTEYVLQELVDYQSPSNQSKKLKNPQNTL